MRLRQSYMYNFLEKLIIIIIILFTVVYYEYAKCYIKYDNYYYLRSKSNIPISQFVQNVSVSNKILPIIKTNVIKKNFLIYQIRLTFNIPMKYSTSFFCPYPYRVISQFWEDSYHFNIIIKTKKGLKYLPLVVNQKGHKGLFTTRYNKKLPEQVIHIRIP